MGVNCIPFPSVYAKKLTHGTPFQQIAAGPGEWIVEMIRAHAHRISETPRLRRNDLFLEYRDVAIQGLARQRHHLGFLEAAARANAPDHAFHAHFVRLQTRQLNLRAHRNRLPARHRARRRGTHVDKAHQRPDLAHARNRSRTSVASGCPPARKAASDNHGPSASHRIPASD